MAWSAFDSVGDSSSGGFIDEPARAKAIELEWFGQLVVAPGCEDMGQCPASYRNRFETPSAPPAIEIESGYGCWANDGTGIMDDIHHACPLPQQAQSSKAWEHLDGGRQHLLRDSETAALREAGEVVERAADDDLALVGLAPISSHRWRYDDRVKYGLDWLADHCLQAVAHDREAKARHRRKLARMARHSHANLFGANLSGDARLHRLHPHDRSALHHEPGDCGVLNYVHAQSRSCPGICPGYGVVPCGSASALYEAAQQGKASERFKIEPRRQFAQLPGIQDLCIDPVESHCVGPSRDTVQVVPGMRQRDHAALTEHDVEVQLSRQTFEQVHREVIESRTLRKQVVGANHRGIASRIAAAQPTLFYDGDVADAVVLCKVVCRCQAMAAAADDNDVITGLWIGLVPSRRPVFMSTAGGAEELPSRISVSHFELSLPVSRLSSS